MRRLCCLIVLSAAAACVALPGAALGATGAVNEYANATAGMATLVPNQTAAPAAGFMVHSHGARQIPRSQSAARRATAAPRAASVGLSAKSLALLANFNGSRAATAR